MSKSYDEFLVYELENTGEKKKLDIIPEDLQNRLNSEQVLIIIREDLRRIFIWKGAKSPVRKRFISSRVAQELQKDLEKDSRYHRCKIVSIDQGDELQEFLNAFKLESMEVNERLPDMRYIRNIEREKMKEIERLSKGAIANQDEEEYYSPGLENRGEDVVISSFAVGIPVKGENSREVKQRGSINTTNNALNLSKKEVEAIKERILAQEVPEDYERQNLILGYTLYGAVSKVTEVFGENVIEVEWEEVKKLPKRMLELDNNKLRVYFNEKRNLVEAIEVLKKKTNDSNSNKDSIKPQTKRQLPKIPNGDG